MVLLDDMTATDHDLQMQSIAHGVVLLEQLNPEYGGERRRLRVVKYRGVKFRGGYHDFVIHRGGLHVFPRLVAAEHRQLTHPRQAAAATSPSSTRCSAAASKRGRARSSSAPPAPASRRWPRSSPSRPARRGQRAALFIFDESPRHAADPLRGSSASICEPALDAGPITLQQVDPAELTPGEFVHAIRTAVEERRAKIIVIDSLNGYLNAMPEERHLTIQLHELLMYLGQKGVATILIGAHQGLIGTQMNTPVDATYLADAVILLRYFESQRRGAPGDLGHEEARQRARADDARFPARSRAHHHRRAAARVPRRADGRADLRGPGEPVRSEDAA